MPEITMKERVDRAKRRLFHWKALIQSIGDHLLWSKDDEFAKDAILATLEPVTEEERKEMWHWIESWRNLCRYGMVHGCDKCELTENDQLSKPICDEYYNKIQNVILGKEKP